MKKRILVIIVMILLLQGYGIYRQNTDWGLFIVSLLMGLMVVCHVFKKSINSTKFGILKREKVAKRLLWIAVGIMALSFFMHPCNYQTDKITIAITHPSCSHWQSAVCIYEISGEECNQVLELLKDYKSKWELPDYEYQNSEFVNLHNGTTITLHTFANYTQRGARIGIQLPFTQYISEDSYQKLLSLLEEIPPVYQKHNKEGVQIDKELSGFASLEEWEDCDSKVEFNWDQIKIEK